MLRLVHAQTVTGSILVDDIDDGLPNKHVNRLGGSGNPKAYARDGYSKAPKQPVYITRVKKTDTTIAGYIDLRETPRVQLSAAKGKILGLKNSGKITVVSFVEGDIVTPTVTSATLNSPGAGDLTIVGTGMLSVAPEISTVIITGTGAVTLTQAQITTGGGTFTNTSVVILAALVPGIATTSSLVKVKADTFTSTPARAVV